MKILKRKYQETKNDILNDYISYLEKIEADTESCKIKWFLLEKSKILNQY